MRPMLNPHSVFLWLFTLGLVAAVGARRLQTGVWEFPPAMRLVLWMASFAVLVVLFYLFRRHG